MLSNLSTATLIALISFYLITLVNFLVFLPIVIYHLHRFWKYRSKEIIVKRRPKLVLVIVILTLIYILIFRSWCAFGDVLYPSLSNLNDRPLYHNYTFSIFLSYFLHFIALLILIRSWFIYYDYQRNAQLLALEWKKLLRYNLEILEQNNSIWTITCGPYLGNSQFIIACAIFLFFITEMIVVLMSWNYNPIHYVYVQIVVNIFIGLLSVFLFYQSLKLKDCIGIRAEIGTIVILFVLFGVFYMIIIFFCDELSYERTLLIYTLYSLIAFIGIIRMIHIRCLLSNVICGACCIYCNQCNKCKIVKIYNDINYNDMCIGDMEIVDESIANVDVKKKRKESISVQIPLTKPKLKMRNYSYSLQIQQPDLDEQPKLYKILSDKNGFELFAAHLIKELSVENILFLIELFELKMTLIHFGFIEKIKWNIDIMNEFILPLHIIDNTMHDNIIQKCIDFLYYLYTEYITTQSYRSINIKSRTRAGISNWIKINFCVLNNNNNNNDNEKIKLIKELFTLLHDNAGQEVYSLLSLDSYYRFSKTPQFKAWHQHTNGVVIDDDD